jgi:hypothetical protein
MTLYSSGDPIVNFSFTLPFGLEAKVHITIWSGAGFHITIPGGSRRKFGFYSGHFPLFD